MTLHRPSNVDDARTLGDLVQQLVAISRELPLVFPVHPRTRKRLEEFGLLARRCSRRPHPADRAARLRRVHGLVEAARAVVTDSGGVQEETTYLGIPCLTLRENTERPITVTQGTNRLVSRERLLESLDVVLAGKWPTGSRPDGWDGQAAQRCVAALRRRHESKARFLTVPDSLPYIARLSRGAIAQLGERLHGMQEVGGSIPPSSTKSRSFAVRPHRLEA